MIILVTKQYYAKSYNGHAVYANIIYGAGPTVTVEITNSDSNWRIRGYQSDSEIYVEGSSGYQKRTFVAEDGERYVLQVYDPVEGTYVNNGNAVFRIDFNEDSGGDDGGDSGDDGDYEESEDIIYARLWILKDEGISDVIVMKIWDGENKVSVYERVNNGDFINKGDRITITRIEYLPGYKPTLHKVIYNNTVDNWFFLYYTFDHLRFCSVNGELQYNVLTPTWQSSSINIHFGSSKDHQSIFIDNDGLCLDQFTCSIDHGDHWIDYYAYIDNGTGWDLILNPLFRTYE